MKIDVVLQPMVSKRLIVLRRDATRFFAYPVPWVKTHG
jgi:hypothetical protein